MTITFGFIISFNLKKLIDITHNSIHNKKITTLSIIIPDSNKYDLTTSTPRNLKKPST